MHNTNGNHTKDKAHDTDIPHSVEAEKAVLGGILTNPRCLTEISGLLRVDDFYYMRHRYIFEAMTKLMERGSRIDALTVGALLQERGVLADVGGHAYLTAIVNETPTSTYVEVYAQLVQRASLRRAMMMASDTIKRLALDGERDFETVYEEAQAALMSIGKRQTDDAAVPLSSVMDDLMRETRRLMQPGVTTAGLSSGFKQLDAMTNGFEPGRLYFLAGRPGMGKSAFMQGLAYRLGAAGIPIRYYSSETSRMEFARRVIAIHTRIATDRQKRVKDLPPTLLDKMMDDMWHLGTFPVMLDDSVALTPRRVYVESYRQQQAVTEMGLQAILIDGFYLMHADERVSSNHLRFLSIANELKATARRLNVPIVVTHQLSRAVEQRQNKRPALSDLREAGEEAADVVLTFYRDAYYNPHTADRAAAEVGVAKARDGQTGIVHLRFDEQHTRWYDV